MKDLLSAVGLRDFYSRNNYPRKAKLSAFAARDPNDKPFGICYL